MVVVALCFKFLEFRVRRFEPQLILSKAVSLFGTGFLFMWLLGTGMPWSRGSSDKAKP